MPRQRWCAGSIPAVRTNPELKSSIRKTLLGFNGFRSPFGYEGRRTVTIP